MKNLLPLLLLSPALGLAACSAVEEVLGERSPAAAEDPAARSHASLRRSHGLASRDLVLPEEEPPEDGDLSAWRRARSTILRTFAFRALEKGLLEEARNYLQEACETDPGDTASHAALARLFLIQGDREAALAYAAQAWEIHPEDEEIGLVYAAALAETERPEEATRILERIWEVNAGDPEFARALLTHYAATGRQDAARRFVQSILENSGDQAAGWALAGDQFLSEGRLEEAVEAYRKALSLDPSTPTPEALARELGRQDDGGDPVLQQALKAEDEGQWVQAERLYRFLLDARPGEAGLQAGLARCLYHQERLEDAWNALEEVPVGVRGWREHLLEAKIRLGLGDDEGARGALLIADRLRPGVDAVALLLEHTEQRLAAQAAAGDPPDAAGDAAAKPSAGEGPEAGPPEEKPPAATETTAAEASGRAAGGPEDAPEESGTENKEDEMPDGT